jgi:hypothetical protein
MAIVLETFSAASARRTPYAVGTLAAVAVGAVVGAGPVAVAGCGMAAGAEAAVAGAGGWAWLPRALSPSELSLAVEVWPPELAVAPAALTAAAPVSGVNATVVAVGAAVVG